MSGLTAQEREALVEDLRYGSSYDLSRTVEQIKTEAEKATAERIAQEFRRQADPSRTGVWAEACALLARIAREIGGQS